MKDEYAGLPIKSFYGTGAKAYCVELNEGETKKAKGISKNAIQKDLHIADYKYIVENGGLIYRKMYVFRSHLHTMFTEMKNKVALSSFDDKRYVIPGLSKTFAWGHKAILSDSAKKNDLDDLVTFATELCDFIPPESSDRENFSNTSIMWMCYVREIEITDMRSGVEHLVQKFNNLRFEAEHEAIYGLGRFYSEEECTELAKKYENGASVCDDFLEGRICEMCLVVKLREMELDSFLYCITDFLSPALREQLNISGYDEVDNSDEESNDCTTFKNINHPVKEDLGNVYINVCGNYPFPINAGPDMVLRGTPNSRGVPKRGDFGKIYNA
ncbi:hypothetical protein NQ318_001288 [Aromia moschata]|uniref:BTB domain-containing protein n=1 Tax=Aromia moschata TaxID=1265417 RepID=A0AAV8ZEZ1_9CUCU|nr:hypothetical protein NQ318_001288 [Aromia moschata]